MPKAVKLLRVIFYFSWVLDSWLPTKHKGWLSLFLMFGMFIKSLSLVWILQMRMIRYCIFLWTWALIGPLLSLVTFPHDFWKTYLHDFDPSVNCIWPKLTILKENWSGRLKEQNQGCFSSLIVGISWSFFEKLFLHGADTWADVWDPARVRYGWRKLIELNSLSDKFTWFH